MHQIQIVRHPRHGQLDPSPPSWLRASLKDEGLPSHLFSLLFFFKFFVFQAFGFKFFVGHKVEISGGRFGFESLTLFYPKHYFFPFSVILKSLIEGLRLALCGFFALQLLHRPVGGSKSKKYHDGNRRCNDDHDN